MDPHDAATALTSIRRTEDKLADRARWPVHRHAMFGLSEGLLIAALPQPSAIRTGMIAVGAVLILACVWDDRRRHGMFISGWQKGATRPLTFMLAAFLATMVWAALHTGRGDGIQPSGMIIGVVTFVICTGASIAWERIYRAALLRGDRS